MTEQSPTGVGSPAGRRVLVAVITGDVGEAIQHWRTEHDPAQARRLPPHATLCYWLPPGDLADLESQIRHALPAPITVRLGAPAMFANADRTIYLPVEQGPDRPLDAARERLFDGCFVPLRRARDWQWHVTCVRYGIRGDPDALLAVARILPAGQPWTIDTVAALELRGDRYEALATWQISEATTDRIGAP